MNWKAIMRRRILVCMKYTGFGVLDLVLLELGGSVVGCTGKGSVSLQTHSKAMDNGRTSRHKSHALMPEDIIHTIFFSMFFISSKHLSL